MIKRLEQHWIQDHAGSVYGATTPSNLELMNKLNEVIDAINRMNDESAGTQPEDP